MINNIIIGKDLLETITSSLYENPIILFREYVQNSVDAYKKAVKEDSKEYLENFYVSIEIEKEDKKIIIKDNGYGIYPTKEFYDKMIRIAKSEKSDRSLYIGFRGIGRLSAMPFCKTLTFINKAAGSSIINICKWEGAKYRELLNSSADDYESFESIVREIANIYDEKTSDSIEDHYFKVIIDEYTEEVEEVISDVNFEQILRKMLPLKYSDEFANAKKIIQKYNQFMEENSEDFMYSIRLNGKELRKNYTDSEHVLESDIVFWEIRGKAGLNNRPGAKLGIMWFTFNKKITSTGSNIDYGVLVRSKNVLMGDNNTFADICKKTKEYVSTHRELTQDLRGVYGELLLNSPNLKDNSSRDWFKPDEQSYFLKYIIVDFMKRLHKYRYSASKYFSKKEQEAKAELKKALVELIDIDINEINVNNFYEEEASQDNASNSKKNEEIPFEFADKDIPRQSKTKKKTYEELMKVIEGFFEKEKQYDIFLKLRAYIKKHFSE